MSDDNPTTGELYEKLDKLIQEYVKLNFDEQGEAEEGDYIASWALVINYGNFDSGGGFPGGYMVEVMPQKNPPHATKGLLREGIDWVKEAQEGVYSDDGDD